MRVPLPTERAHLLTPRIRHWYALQERFRHAQLGRASNAVLQVKLPVSIQTAAEAANYFVVCFVIVIFTDSDD
jgi:hypothetical protein